MVNKKSNAILETVFNFSNFCEKRRCVVQVANNFPDLCPYEQKIADCNKFVWKQSNQKSNTNFSLKWKIIVTKKAKNKEIFVYRLKVCLNSIF